MMEEDREEADGNRNDHPAATASPPPAPGRAVSVVTEHHDVSLALLAGMLVIGGGQFYNGQAGKGALLLFLFMLGLLFIVLIGPRSIAALLPVGVPMLLVWLIGLFDAGLIAGRLKRRQTVRLWQWF